MPALDRIRANVARLWRGGTDADRALRRRQLMAKLGRHVFRIRLLLLAVGYLWMAALPVVPDLSQRTYIDENALQPSMVNTYWTWVDVQRADKYLAQLERMHTNGATGMDRANFITGEFRKLGLTSHTQSYSFSDGGITKSGVNSYAISTSPRASGSEAIVISATWLSCIDEGQGAPNMRGVATVLSLASFLKQYSHWAKDLIFVISDGYQEGMHAWLSAYHHSAPQYSMTADGLELSPGVIWTALNIDYPGHSFSHLGAYHEGLNGRLPNQDLFNSVQVISHVLGVPVVLYNETNYRADRSNPSLWQLATAPLRRRDEMAESFKTSDYIDRHMEYQTYGKSSGAHGLFHQYRIDAITLFAVPAVGPHGFHALGRITESTLRTANNLLEHLHASFFFYILTGPGTFMKIGSYLPSAILISVSLMIGGLSEYVNAGWEQTDGQWSRRSRPILPTLTLMVVTHAAGSAFFLSLSDTSRVTSSILLGLIIALPVRFASVLFTEKRRTSTLLKAFNLCLASTVITITSLLNFSLAATLASHLGLALTLLRRPTSIVQSVLLTAITGGLTCFRLVSAEKLSSALHDWSWFGNWFAPFVFIVYLPLVVQAILVPYV